MAVIGCGCSMATESVAQISRFWNITQVCAVYLTCNCGYGVLPVAMPNDSSDHPPMFTASVTTCTYTTCSQTSYTYTGITCYTVITANCLDINLMQRHNTMHSLYYLVVQKSIEGGSNPKTLKWDLGGDASLSQICLSLLSMTNEADIVT